MSIWHNPIAEMYGPYFLIFYSVVVTGVIIFSKWKIKQLDDTLITHPALQIPTQIDPYEVAYLRGRVHEVIRVAVYKLLKMGYLTTAPLATRKPKSTAQQIQASPTAPDPSLLSPIESELFMYFSVPHTTAEMFSTPLLISRIDAKCREYDSKIRQELLIALPEWRSERAKIVVPAVSVIVLLGLYKLTAALINSHENVGFLFFEMIFATFFTILSVNLPLVTQRGIRYLNDLRHAYGSMAMSNYNHESSGLSPDVAILPMAILGVASLTATPDAAYGQLFSKASRPTSSGSCGGSSAGCGGGGGGCGSGSCSGGGGDGGGCGGCGGGGD